MAQVTVQQLAETVGASVDRLLSQMKDAGLPHKEAEEAVSDEDKQTLLAFLKKSHGESTDAPKKITLKRKTISTLRTGGSQGKKTVNVEVRKKRTYVKRDPAEEVAEEPVLEEAPAVEAELAEAPAPAVEEPVEAVAAPDAGVIRDVAGRLLEVRHEPAPLEHLGEQVGGLLASQVDPAQLGHRVVPVLEEDPVVELLGSPEADGGVDGLVANYFYRHNCLCEHCQKDFRAYLQSRFTAEEFRHWISIGSLFLSNASTSSVLASNRYSRT